MKKIIALLALLLSASALHAQPSGQLAPGESWGNPTAAARVAIPASVAAMLDRGLCSTTGAFPVRTAGGWVCGIFSTNLSLVGNVLTAAGGGTGSPGGGNTQVQFNNASAFGGSANLTWISPTLQVGSTAGATGILAMAGITSGIVSIKTQDVAGTYNFNLPTTAGASGECLRSGGGGGAPTTWVTCAAPVGANTQVQFNNLGAFGASPNLTWISPKLTIGLAGTITGQLGMAGATSGNATLQAQAVAGTPVLTLPNTTGTFAVNAVGLLALDAITGQISTQMATGFLVGRSTAGAGVMEQITVGTNLTLVGGTLNASSGGPASGIMVPGGRLTLTSAVPVTSTDVAGGPIVYYAPFNHTYVPVYDGANMVLKTFTASATDAVGLSVTLGANWTINTNYDFFVGVNAAVVTLCSGPSWNSGTAGSDIVRGTGAGSTDVQLFNGIWTNKNSMTCRYANASTFTCGVNQCTLVGTVRMTASGQTSDTVAFRFVSNAYNAVPRPMRVIEATSSWNYTAATYRQANANPANQLDFVQTLPGGRANANVQANWSSSGASPFASVGIDLDTVNTTSLVNNINFLQYAYVANNIVGQAAFYTGFPGLGRHTLIWKEYAQALSTATWYGNAGGSILQSGIFGEIMN